MCIYIYLYVFKKVAKNSHPLPPAITSGWEVLIDRAKSSLLHCECPWGGELLKIRVDAHAPWHRAVGQENDSAGVFDTVMAMTICWL